MHVYGFEIIKKDNNVQYDFINDRSQMNGPHSPTRKYTLPNEINAGIVVLFQFVKWSQIEVVQYIILYMYVWYVESTEMVSADQQ